MERSSAFNRLYLRLKRSCKERNIFVDLTFNAYKELIVQPCQYCKAPPKATNNEPALKGFKFNGLDRIDNKKGYYEQNVVPCCPLCNSMKSKLTHEEFIEHIKKISDNH